MVLLSVQFPSDECLFARKRERSSWQGGAEGEQPWMSW
jgi:hypothetical protein